MNHNRGERLPGEVYTPEEIDRFMRSFPKSSTSARNRALCTVYLRAMLRCNEALDLRPCDVQLDECSITVMRGKGNKRRVVGIDRESIQVVEDWISVRPASRFLFCTRSGGRLSDSYVRRMVKSIARRAGIEKRFHVHGLRHSGAFELANEGMDIRLIAAQLGHSSIAVTDRYIQHLNPRQLIEAMRVRKAAFA